MELDAMRADAPETAQYGNRASDSDLGLGRDAFLQILVAQLQYQDPMNPMDDRDFIAQMAQFSTLTQMQTLVRHQITSLGAGLLGRDLAIESATGERIEGRVESIGWRDDELIISTAAGDTLPMSEVSQMRWLDAPEGESDDGSE